MNQKLQVLGKVIGDVLIIIEQELISATQDALMKEKITIIINFYAEIFDKILQNHKTGMGKEIKKLMTSLFDDLEKIINSGNDTILDCKICC